MYASTSVNCEKKNKNLGTEKISVKSPEKENTNIG